MESLNLGAVTRASLGKDSAGLYVICLAALHGEVSEIQAMRAASQASYG